MFGFFSIRQCFYKDFYTHSVNKFYWLVECAWTAEYISLFKAFSVALLNDGLAVSLAMFTSLIIPSFRCRDLRHVNLWRHLEHIQSILYHVKPQYNISIVISENLKLIEEEDWLKLLTDVSLTFKRLQEVGGWTRLLLELYPTVIDITWLKFRW